MWKLTEYGKSRVGLPGVPWQDLTNAEFAAAKRLHPGIQERGYFEHFTEAEAEAKAAEPVIDEAAQPDEAAATPEEVIGGRPPRTKKGG